MNQGTKMPATNKAQDNLAKVVGIEEAEFVQLNLLTKDVSAVHSLLQFLFDRNGILGVLVGDKSLVKAS